MLESGPVEKEIELRGVGMRLKTLITTEVTTPYVPIKGLVQLSKIVLGYFQSCERRTSTTTANSPIELCILTRINSDKPAIRSD